MTRARRLAAAFAGWTLLVWATRIRNVVSDPEVMASDQVVALGRAAAFLVLGAAVVVSLLRTRRGPLERGGRAAVWTLAGFTVVVWTLATIDIVLDPDHAASFKLVHTALAAVSVALAVAAARAVRAVQASPGDAPTPGRDPRRAPSPPR